MMLRKPPPANRDPGVALAVTLDNLPNCLTRGVPAQLPNALPLSSLCHQNGYNFYSIQHQESFLNTRLSNKYISSIRSQIQGLIHEYISQRLRCSVWEDAAITEVVKYLDGRLHEEATSLENYMDLNTLISRLDKLMPGDDKGTLASSAPSLSTDMMALGTGTTLPEGCTTPMSSSNAFTFPGLYDADDVSKVKRSCLPDTKGGNSYEQLQWFSGNKFSYENPTFWKSMPSNTLASTYPDSTLSAKQAAVENLYQIGSNNLGQRSFMRNVINDVMPAPGSDASHESGYISYVPISEELVTVDVSTKFSAHGNCFPSVSHDSFGSYGLASSQSLLTSVDNGYSSFKESSLTTPQQFYHIAPQCRQQSFAGSNPSLRSSISGINNLQMSDQKTNKEESNVTSDILKDELQFTGTHQIPGQSLSCTHMESSGKPPSQNSGSSVIGHGSCHIISRVESMDKSSEHQVQRGGSLTGSTTATSMMDYQEFPSKRLKLDPPWTTDLRHSESSRVVRVISDPLTRTISQEVNGDGNLLVLGKKNSELDIKHYSSSSQGSSGTFSEVKSELSGASTKRKSDALDVISAKNNCIVREEVIQLETKVAEFKTELKHAETKEAKKIKLKGVSLIEWFNADQVKEHLKSFRHLHEEGISTVNTENGRESQYPLDENICQICGLSSLSFDPPTIYCSACLNRIGRSRAYYTVASAEVLASAGQNYFCNTCYKGSHGGSIQYGKFSILKSMLEKKKNDDRVPEPWVQCDKCAAWQHQICTLFNDKRNEEERAEYICPKCYLDELESGERKPLPPNTLLGAKDLPKSKLSEYIEKRLFTRLGQEQEERAKMSAKQSNEVPEANELVVRVVSSVDRSLEVLKPFSEIFEELKYPKEFSYKSKAILLFQTIKGADVCLFGMYVQEYGSKCGPPNQRHIYLSYIDSVKYFQPDIKALSGEALRTLVYHEILIAYLDYSKRRGFASCYIWVCPATKREDFIFNCHPEKQKMPKKDKLREWYFAMVEKATKEDIVVHKTNIYDQFFVPANDRKDDITAARLPYFDGDYWPGIAEKVLDNLQEQEEGKGPQKKGKIGISRRAMNAVRHSTSPLKSKDILLMSKLEELILPKKEDFILLHLQHSCNLCYQLIMSGKRWLCNVCKNFQLCEKCHDKELELDDKDRHPIGSSEKHSFTPADVNDVPENTTDDDENMQSEIFDSRIAFLGLCQAERYQYDTLRHAKYSTMMILYHIHNAVPPSLITVCAFCHCDLKTGQAWHCEACPDYDLCYTCYLREGRHHCHPLVGPQHFAFGKEQSISSQHRHTVLEKNLVEILEHASACFTVTCSYKFCRHLKIFFRHCTECRVRLKGGCPHCKKIWYLLRLHAQSCNKQVCQIPRCLDLRTYLSRSKE